MVLVTGPTGSGKTVSLYTCLNILNQPGVNICTVEDPAEINLPGVNQVNVNDKAGLTFAAALKSFLRQDPDIIMVGEIRDLETADIAIKAAQTGHMVMSTLHTNDAPTTLTRLLNMGVAPFNIASSVLLITAQRLARRLCENCKTPADYPREALLRAGFSETDLDGSWKPYRAVGCSACNNGYKGRVGIYQVMPITEAIQRIILSRGHGDWTSPAGPEVDGVRDLRQSGLVKVRVGVTTLEEVISVTNEYASPPVSHRHVCSGTTRCQLQSPQEPRTRSSSGKARTRTARSCAARSAPAARPWSAPACAARAS
jgi:type IV pilus assembly protein PilB